ncbi:DUF421 domain-containing protein [Frigoriflavimonas asaccharolytica]|uniref:Uncharacterized membrane protein YcaP (DUF421 family) n=1 Tax=Frigoriflavimonas asaccharolytica TaxID=2735899 RepID=A0A8J8K8J5_9FLAO|nr:YetF domain-containing protein [Frigoriflavimonas asaccharolytica]NRS92027.1 uncharacterized membrane protein YcaP (DUF421 family) [Frigoriflavimonas asaccharolytica]
MIEGNEYSFDLFQIFFGDFNLTVYLEILIRVIIIMAYTILIIRWIGKRAVGGLGSADILLIIAMGSAVGDAMLYPTIPLLIPISVISLIAIFQKIYVYIGIKHESVRKITHPTVLKLVENGKLLKQNFTIDEIDENEVYMLLREAGIQYLSEVEHAYYEQSGQLSVFKYENPIFKNSILPENLKHEK